MTAPSHTVTRELTWAVTFGRDHLDAFADLSHDRNPLHVDARYAAKTPFGQNVVYGVAAVLAALGHWAAGRRFGLRSLRAQFRAPLFVGQDYRLNALEIGNVVEMQFLRGGTIQVALTFEWYPYDRPGVDAAATVREFEPRRAAMDYGSVDEIERGGVPTDVVYCPNVGGFSRLARFFTLEADQLPAAQLSAILWSSFFVGMEVPGRQALFSELTFEFSDALAEGPAIRMTDLHLSARRSLQRLALSGTGDGIRRFTAVAFVRPRPVAYDADDIARQLPESADFAERVVFISGGSRGFGSVLARCFARQAATLVVAYRSQVEDAERLRQDLADAGTDCLLVRGDVRSESDCSAMAGAIQTRYGGIDVLLNNASPPIESRRFDEWTVADFMSFVSDSVRTYAQATHTLLPLVRPGGLVVNVSSAYTRMLPPNFVPYITAKSAIEGFTRALAREYADVTFVTARPPRMLTDQTNVGFELKPPASAVGVATKLLLALHNLPSGTNYHELDLT